MARLPQPGGDTGAWGDILNNFLEQAHASDGTLKPLDQSLITGLTDALASKVEADSLSAVAVSGDYDDLSNKPVSQALDLTTVRRIQNGGNAVAMIHDLITALYNIGFPLRTLIRVTGHPFTGNTNADIDVGYTFVLGSAVEIAPPIATVQWQKQLYSAVNGVAVGQWTNIPGATTPTYNESATTQGGYVLDQVYRFRAAWSYPDENMPTYSNLSGYVTVTYWDP